MTRVLFGAAALVCAAQLAACSTTQSQSAADLNAAFNIAASGEAVYAAQANANPKTVAQMEALLSSAQAALLTWTNSQGAGNQAALNAAIAALVAYEVASKAPAAPAVPAAHAAT